MTTPPGGGGAQLLEQGAEGSITADSLSSGGCTVSSYTEACRLRVWPSAHPCNRPQILAGNSSFAKLVQNRFLLLTSKTVVQGQSAGTHNPEDLSLTPKTHIHTSVNNKIK